ncbi:unnamed protein product [Periconia digitata]|uniref:MADS-box domain-containing protein n=1 Tax=Periconia digitata TaxID=1303443 RepID=A0A9W4XXM6_9PLEO|nr:unnamed protein product [Periconia digitata]
MDSKRDSNFFERRRTGLDRKAKDLVLQNQNVKILTIYGYGDDIYLFRSHPHLEWPWSHSDMERLLGDAVEERNMDNYSLEQKQIDRMAIWRQRQGLVSWTNQFNINNSEVAGNENDILSRVPPNHPAQHPTAHSSSNAQHRAVNNRIDNQLELAHRQAEAVTGALQDNTSRPPAENVQSPSKMLTTPPNDISGYVQDAAFDQLPSFTGQVDESFDPWPLSPPVLQVQPSVRPSPKSIVKAEPVSDDEPDENDVTDEEYFNPGDMTAAVPSISEVQRNSPKRRRTDSNTYHSPRPMISASSPHSQGFTPINGSVVTRGIRQTQSHPTLRAQPTNNYPAGRLSKHQDGYATPNAYNLRRGRYHRG